MDTNLNKHILQIVFDFVTPEKKTLPKWAKRFLGKSLYRIKRNSIHLDDYSSRTRVQRVQNNVPRSPLFLETVSQEIIAELDDIWRFANEVVLDFFYGKILGSSEKMSSLIL